MTLNQDCRQFESAGPGKTTSAVNHEQNIQRTIIKHVGRNEALVSFDPISIRAPGPAVYPSAGWTGGIEWGKRIRRPVSRVLCPSFAKAPEGGGHSSRPRIAARLARPTRTARAGDGPALARAEARRPYLVLLQAGLAMPSLSPGPRCALTAPFHPCPASPRRAWQGGLLSVALSLGSRPAGVTRRLVAVEPGLSSFLLRRGFGGPRPPGRLIRGEHGPRLRPGQPSTNLRAGGTVAIWIAFDCCVGFREAKFEGATVSVQSRRQGAPRGP